MPRVRYGPDITDDAQFLILEDSRIKNKLAKAKSEKTRAKLLKERDLLRQAEKQIFGNRANARKLARESVSRQGYLADSEVKALGAKRFKQIKGKGQLGLASTPGRKTQQIGRKQGYKARPETAHKELYASATAKAKSSDIMRRIREQKKVSVAAKKKAKKSSAKKAAPTRKKKAAKKAAPAKKATPVKKAAAKKTPAKKSAPRKKR
jgi:uncharacterized membrane protein YqiK